MQYTVNDFKQKLATDQRWLERGILAIWDCQTAQERAGEFTLEKNGVGFNKFDSPVLSSFAKWILEGKQRYNKEIGKCLTPKQVVIAQKKMTKYAGQLHQIAYNA